MIVAFYRFYVALYVYIQKKYKPGTCSRLELADLIINGFAAAHYNNLFKAAVIQCINNHQVVEASIAANILYLSA